MKLADVIDLETQLVLDERVDSATLHARDRALFRSIVPIPAGDEETLSAWLAALRERFGAPRVGERVVAGQRLLGYLLVGLALSIGWGTAEVLLHFEEGASPINLGHYLAVLVFGQLSLLALLLVGMLLRSLFSSWPLLGDLQRLLRFIALRLSLRERLEAAAGPQGAAAVSAFRRLRTRAGLYTRSERYLWLAHGQLFGVAFNLGVVAAFVRLIVFSDLVFAWSTSAAAVDPAAVQRLCEALSLPFAALFPDAVPSPLLIERTQYFRLEGRFAGAPIAGKGDVTLVGQWWPFLLACTVTYGLLPRALLLVYFRARLWRAERTLPLDTPQVQRVLSRLRTPAVATRAPRPATDAPEPARPVTLAEHSATDTALVLYRDIPTSEATLCAAVQRDLCLAVTAVHRAGGLDVAADAALCQALAARDGAVTVVVEAWEAPDKMLRGFLASVRAAVGVRRSLYVALIGEASEEGFSPADLADVRLFRDRLSLLEDPYLAVEALAPMAESTLASAASNTGAEP